MPIFNRNILLELTSDIVIAHLGNNPIDAAQLPTLITCVHDALAILGKPVEPDEPAMIPAVPIHKSVRRDHLVCLEDGKTFASLKRHLMAHHGLTPDAYRVKWGLPDDYPMVAASYSERRQAMAIEAGLGHITRRKRKTVARSTGKTD